MLYFRIFLEDWLIANTIQNNAAEVASFTSLFLSSPIGVSVAYNVDVEKVAMIKLKPLKPAATVFCYTITGGTEN
jgi:hypothetical protein